MVIIKQVEKALYWDGAGWTDKIEAAVAYSKYGGKEQARRLMMLDDTMELEVIPAMKS